MGDIRRGFSTAWTGVQRLLVFTLWQHVDDRQPGVVEGQAVPGAAGVKQPLLHVAVVSAGVRQASAVDGQAVLVRGHALKLQAGLQCRPLPGVAVAVPENGVVPDGENTLPLPVSVGRLAVVCVLRTIHVPGHGEAGVSGGLGGNAAAQLDRVGLFHGHIGLRFFHLQSNVWQM